MALIAFSIHYESESITDIFTVFMLEQLVTHQFAKNLELQKRNLFKSQLHKWLQHNSKL
jgi:hypothetical protein